MTDGLGLGERVVEVLHDRGTREQPDWTVGSGFVVSGGRILTAAHNVGTSGDLLVRFLGAEEHPATVCTLTNGQPAVEDEYDLAVIELTNPADDRPSVAFARIEPQPMLGTPNVEGCWAVGFPRFQERTRGNRDRPVRESARIDGYIPMGEGLVEGRPTLAAIRAPRELPGNDQARSEWQGMSGAVVFADRLVIGVITEHHRPAGSGSLIIAPVALLDGRGDAAEWWALLGVEYPEALPKLPLNRPPLPLRAALREAFAPLLERHLVGFGGREAQQARLDEFIQQQSGRYLVISGPAGFGKTALLANLVRRAPETIAYHFFAPNDVIESVDETFFVRNAVQQMASWHGASVDLPTALADLKALYHRLLDLPIEGSRVLLLDGVDEVRDWNLRYYLGRQLPPGLNVILSVRDVGQDWLDDYGLPAQQTTELPLGGFTRDDVARVLAAAGPKARSLVENPTILDELMRVAASEEHPSLADPFYVRILAGDAQAGRITAASIADEPPGLDRYLDNWWQDVRKTAGEQTVQDLVGTLVGALGPLTKDELVAINPSLAGGWAGDLFERDVLPKVRRFLVGDAERGYALTHPRLQRYLRSKPSLAAYRERLLAFCAGWPSRPSRYASRHFAKHLAEDPDNIDERHALFKLVDNREWYDSQIALDPSGAAYAADVAQAWATASEVDRKAVSAGRSAPLLAREVRCALATASLRSLSRSIGSVFLGQLVQAGLWTPAEALSAIRQNPHSGAKARALAALAPLAPEAMQVEIITEARSIQDDAARADALSNLVEVVPPGLRELVVAEALSAAASAPDHSSRADALTILAPLVPDDQRAGVVEQALVAARKIDYDEEARAGALTALADLVPRAKRRGVVEEALAAAREIDYDMQARAGALTFLADVVPRDKRRGIIGEALAAAREIDVDDAQARADALTALVHMIPRDQRRSVVVEALAAARSVGLSSLVATAAEVASKANYSAILKEALDVAEASPTPTEQAGLLTSIGEVVFEDDAGDILAEALDAAHLITDRPEKVSALLWLARLVPEDRGNELVREALSAPGAIQAVMTIERDEVERVHTMVVIAAHLRSDRKRAVLQEAAALAGAIERPYESARGLTALVPYAGLVDDRLVDKVLTAAELTDDLAERVHILSELLSAVGDDRRREVMEKALVVARAIDYVGMSVVGTITDDGVVHRAPTTPWQGSPRPLSLAAIALSLTGNERDALLAEALDAAYMFAHPAQVSALANLAPQLPEELVRRALTDLAVTKQPLRIYAAGLLLARAQEFGFVESALDEAVRLWGATPPDDLLIALGDRELDGDENMQIRWSVSVTEEPFWALLPLGSDGKFATVDFDPPPPWPAVAQSVEDAEASVLRGYLAWYVPQLPAADVRALFDGPLIGSVTWQPAWVAMLARLADLGFADNAREMAEINWPDGLPPEVAVALVPHAPQPARVDAVEAALAAAENVGDDLARVQLLAKLVPHVPESKRERIVRQVEDLAHSVAEGLPLPSELVEGLASVHSILSPQSSLALWQDELRAAAAGIRQELVDVLPALLITGERFDGNELWEGLADAILDVPQWWP